MLHEIIQYARTTGIDSEPGFNSKWVRWLLVFDSDGKFVNITDFKEGKAKGREFSKCPEFTFSEMISNRLRHFLVDAADKVVLLTKDKPTQKELDDHSSYVSLLASASTAIPELASIAHTLNDETSLTAVRRVLTDLKAKPTDSCTIATMVGTLPKIFVDETDWHDWWRAYRESLAVGKQEAKSSTAANQMRCFLSGKMVEPAATQNKVTGLSDVGGLSTGDVLSSFDKESFGHYGFAKGENAAMSVEMVKLVTDSLNHLIGTRSRRLCGTKVVYWYSKPIAQEDDLLSQDIFGDLATNDTAEEDADGPSQQEMLAAESRASQLLDAIQSGQRADLLNCEYYALTISGNSGRVIVRDWMQGSFESLAKNVKRWFDDLSIIARDGKSTIRKHKFAAVLGAMVRDLRDMPAPTVATLWRAALAGTPIPPPLAAQVLSRVRMDVIGDQTARHARLGFLRAFIIRNTHLELSEMTTEVDDSIDDPAYLCGRIMAVLANIQQAALGDVGAGVVQRYYAAASATPALVLGRLVRTAQIAHLPKIDGGLRHHFESQMTQLWSRMKTAPPTTLTLEQQTLFALGFYQQQATRYAKKEASVSASAI
ncbi:MAG TPA: type I-C CRISPR-associated protein Cas8c/Csd1 [Planctomycetaceae bacterium]|nr:type I-C CRISPR-associated protein Cas8c/Csd1 [Planctomycetaceae bacterium]